MTDRDDARAALAATDWTDATVDAAKPRASVVFSVRVPAELADWIGEEADRRAVPPSMVIRDAVAAARSTSAADQTVTVRRSDLHRVIDTLFGPVARPTRAAGLTRVEPAPSAGCNHWIKTTQSHITCATLYP